MLTENDINRLKAAKSVTEWIAECDRIKAEHGGQYPGDWFNKVIKCSSHFPVLDRINGVFDNRMF